jgi:hypothetical protein
LKNAAAVAQPVFKNGMPTYAELIFSPQYETANPFQILKTATTAF